MPHESHIQYGYRLADGTENWERVCTYDGPCIPSMGDVPAIYVNEGERPDVSAEAMAETVGDRGVVLVRDVTVSESRLA